MPRASSKPRATRASLRSGSSPAVANTPHALPARTRSNVQVVVPRFSASFDSPASRSSGPTSTRSVSLASETPETSVVVTPAQSILKGRGRTSLSRKPDLSALSKSGNGVLSKRKRASFVDDEDAEDSSIPADTSKDEELAMLIQEEEYIESEDDDFILPTTSSSHRPLKSSKIRVSLRSARKTARSFVVPDSVDESELSDPLSEIEVHSTSHLSLATLTPVQTPSESDDSLDVPIMRSRPIKRRRVAPPTVSRRSNATRSEANDSDPARKPFLSGVTCKFLTTHRP